MGINQVFLGITVVGIIMTFKVIVDGLRESTAINDSIGSLRASIGQCRLQQNEEEQKSLGFEQEMENLKASVLDMERKEKEMNHQIRELRASLEGQKFKLDSPKP